MRIGLVCPYDMSQPGGVQAQVKGLAFHLSASGDEAVVLGPGLPPDLEGVDLGGSVTIPGNKSKVPLSPDPRVGHRMRRAVADLDLLHVHEPLMPFVSLGALRAGVPVVGTFHAAPGTVGKGFYTVARPWLRSLLGPNVRKVTAVSRTAAAPLPRELDITIVPNGVDVAGLASTVERNPRRVAFLGRDDKRKGLDVLLRAWDRVVAEVEEAELVVMGADRGVGGGIKWLGRVDEQDKRDGLGSAAVYVAPNLGGESFGVVLVEAMAAGTAVVASDLRAFQEVGGEAVRYFETGNSTDLATTLIELLADRDAMEAMARAGTERAWRFDWSTVTASYRDVYEAALS